VCLELNEFVVMTRVVKFGDIEMGADTERNEDVTVQMECVKGVVHLSKRFGCMNWVSG